MPTEPSVPAHPADADPTRTLDDARVIWLTPTEALERLATGSLEVEGQFMHGSNHTFLAVVAGKGPSLYAVYKPRRGEQPLWDFPSGTLARRELAAHALSEALGWDLVPPTVLRNGPIGPGMVQLFIPHDPALHFLILPSPDDLAVSRLAAFDIVANNADRKSGHVLAGPDGRLWAIDHGLTFHEEPKLRTVIWEPAGTRLPESVSEDIARVAAALADRRGDLRRTMQGLLTAAEVGATVHRAKALLRTGRLPEPDPNVRHLPWPPV
ncbi:MAG: SCO1664 family protein [Ardenticatenales bacterium]